MGLGTMFLACLLMLCIGIERWNIKASGETMSLIWVIGGLATLMMMQRGYYWNIFDRSPGPLTANRVSALAIFAALYFVAEVAELLATIYRRFKRR